MEGRDAGIVTVAYEDDARQGVGLAGERAGRSVQRRSNVGEDDAVVEFARLEHGVPDRAARVDRLEDLLMTGGDRLAGVQLAPDRDEDSVEERSRTTR